MSRAGNKPNLLSWVRNSGTVFLSFSDWHVFFDRLRFTPEQFVDEQIVTLEELGLELIYKRIDTSTADTVNGNIKLILKLVDEKL